MINQNRRNLGNRRSRGRGRQEPQLSVEDVSVEPDASISPLPTKSNDEYILEEYNLQLANDGQPRVSMLPSGTSDGYKLGLLNDALRRRGLPTTPVLPDDVSPNPQRSQEFEGLTDRNLIDRENILRSQLQIDPGNQDIRNQMMDINKEQLSRSQLLAEELSKKDTSTSTSSLRQPSVIDQRLEDINQKINSLETQLERTPSGQQRRDITDELKNLEYEFELLTDPQSVSERLDRQINELKQPVEPVEPAGPAGPAKATPLPLDVDEGPKETSFDASNPDSTTNERLVPGNTRSPMENAITGAIEKVSGAITDVSDTITGNTRPPSIGASNVPGRQQEPDTEPDLEDTREHHESTEADTILDNTLDFEHPGASRSNFDNNFIGFILNTILKRSLTQGGLDSNKADILGDTAMSGIGILYDNLKTGKLQNDYNRLSIEPSKTSSLTRPTIPLVIITAYLYLVDKETDFKIGINFITRPIIRHILSGVLGFEGEDIEYSLSILESIPNELKTAYLKQKGEQPAPLSSQEISAIGLFIDKVNKDYFKRYKKELKKELFNYENKQSLYLYEMLETLNSSSVLFQISSAFNTIGELISEMKENPYLLIQLFALLYNDIEGDDFTASNLLNQSKVDKLIYYYSNVGGGGRKPNDKVDILRDIDLETGKRGQTPGLQVIENDDKVALYKTNDRYYVVFRGTDKKDMADIRMNFMNFGGKDLFNNPEYNERMITGMRYLDQAIDLSRQQRIEPPVILGYSLGSVSAMTLSQLYPNIETDVYNPVLSKSPLTETIMDRLESSNIHFNYNEKDPISTNMNYYKLENPNLDIKKYSNNKFFNPHDVRQFQ